MTAALRSVGILAAGFALFVALVWLVQRRLIYFPSGGSVGSAGGTIAGAEDVVFETPDGLQLRAWFVPARSAPRATVLAFPGNAGNRESRAPLAAALSRRGFSVLLVDYRGYGGNPGRPSERGLAEDARGALRWLVARPDVDRGRLVFFGESLGAAVAVGLAAELEPALLVLRSPFTSLVDVARVHYPFLPVRWLLEDRYPSLGRVARLGGPLLVVAGASDAVVPPEQSRRLFEAAASRAKRFVLVPGAGHNDGELVVGAPLLAEVDRAWDEAARAATEEGR